MFSTTMKIVSIDFETANYSPVSMCSVGIAILEDLSQVKSHYWKVKPPRGHDRFIQQWTDEIHGLSWADVKDQAEFSAIAGQVNQHLSTADLVVAHNAPFDMRVLRATLTHFGLSSTPFPYLCTYRLAKKEWPELPNHRLSTVAQHLSIALHHHHAQSDAEAAVLLLRAAMQNLETTNLADLHSKTAVEPKHFQI
jgi:DNA polymerase III subunit epsilon